MFPACFLVLVLLGVDTTSGFHTSTSRSRHLGCLAKRKTGPSSGSSPKGFKPVATTPPLPKVDNISPDPALLDLVPENQQSESRNDDELTTYQVDGRSKKETAAKALMAKANETDVDEQIKKSKMFQSITDRRLSELDEKIRKLKEEEALIASDPSVGAVPELVANRMIRRIGFFFGIPVFGGLSLFIAAIIASKKYDTVIPPYVMAYATQIPFVVGLAGITYAILSSSWDEQPGSLLGVQEFKTNFGRIKEGLSRTRSTAELRDEIDNEKKRLGRR